MGDKKNIPKIRFKEFDGDWEEFKIGEVLTEKKRPIELVDDNLYQLVTVKRRNGGVVPRSRLKGKDILVKNYFEIQAGDYLISKRQVVHGANGIVPKRLDKAVVSNEYLIAIDNENITTQFWTVFSKRADMHKKFFISSYGVDIEKLVFDVDDWKKRTVVIPELAEQNTITDYFQQLDNLIALHKRKYDKLLNVKKAMLEKMFPKKGEKVPEIRFKGFSEKWEERSYSKVFTSITNNTLSRAELNYNFGFAKNIHYGDVLIKFGELLDIEKEEVPFITNKKLVNKFKSSKLQSGDVIIADAAEDETVGKCTELVNVGEEIIFSGLHTIPIRPTLLFASKYLGYYMNSSAYHNQLLPLMQGTKVLSISKSAIQNTTIYFPNDCVEQSKIGNLFKKLDTILTLHQSQLEKLKHIKKACLEKMFV